MNGARVARNGSPFRHRGERQAFPAFGQQFAYEYIPGLARKPVNPHRSKVPRTSLPDHAKAR
jgi:hypothetical protein